MSIRKTIGGILAGLGATLLAMAGSAHAGDYEGNFMIRLQGTDVITQDKLKGLTLNSAVDLKKAGFDTSISDQWIPTATLTYFLNKNLALELFCCFSKHSADLKTPAGSAALAGEVATSWIFPPILTLQYHFTGMGAFKPYIGGGLQYIHFFDSTPGANSLGAGMVKFRDAWGPAVQAGIDIAIGGGWYLNADVKKTWIETNADWYNASKVGAGAMINAKEALDPLTVSVGVGYRFDLFGRGHIETLK